MHSIHNIYLTFINFLYATLNYKDTRNDKDGIL